MNKKTHVFLLNLILIIVWHISSFIACILLKGNIFDGQKKFYQPHKWEKNGKVYKQKLKINKWKDKVPQYIGKEGFSKQSFDVKNATVEYIDEFIYETCRGEWNHRINVLYAPIAVIVNIILKSPVNGILFSFVSVIANLPFLIIQRYNRFRLYTVRKKVVRDSNRTLKNNKEL